MSTPKYNKERYPTPSNWPELIAKHEASLGFPICAARNRQNLPCTNKAGKGTDHLGEGRCKYHGGRNQSPDAKNYKHGKYALIPMTTNHPELAAKMQELAKDHDVFDLEVEILRLRGIIEIMVDQDDLLSAAKLSVDLSKIVERLHLIQVGRRYVISIENVSTIIETVKAAIFRHVPDEYTRRMIAGELNTLRLPNRPTPRLIEGEVIDAEG